nr:MAG TPA: hypothetical protein [Caudoviricetes sp.]
MCRFLSGGAPVLLVIVYTAKFGIFFDVAK